jgi:hypothetical protein
MKIGINLVGVSYNNAKEGGRLRNYEDAIENFYKYIVEPFREKGHEVQFYLYSYENEKQDKIVNDYIPCIKSQFVKPDYNKLGGGVSVSEGYKVMSVSYLNSLEQLKNEDLDLVISTRFDIKFLKNPFKEYNFDFNKFNFLWREPEFTHLPIVNDTFLVFPYKMIDNVKDSIIEMEENPPHDTNVAMHNWYLPMVNQVGEDKVQWVDDRFRTALENELYILTRKG